MRWASRLATEPDGTASLEAALAGLTHDLDGAAPDLVFAFASPEFDAHLDGLAERLWQRSPDARLIGCSGGGIIGAAQELEQEPGLSLVAASLPGVTVQPFHVELGDLPTGEADAWRAAFGVHDAENRHVVVLPDPFSMDIERLVNGLDTAWPDGVQVGGLASGGHQPRSHRLVLDDQVHDRGAVGVALGGNLTVETVVAQGCRPIGPPMFVTRCQRNVLHTLDGKSAMAALQDVLHGLDAETRAIARTSLFVGVVMRPQQQRYGPGDFLIRNLMGLDPRSGALIVGARLEPQSVVQFHVRDAQTSAADLEGLLRRSRMQMGRPPAGALLFSCLGRGRRHYGVRDHDSDAIVSELGAVPVGGFFCNGEIGPVQGQTFLHGYTSAIALFRPRLDA